LDRRLLDILCCPATRQDLSPASRAQLDALNQAAARGGLERVDGSVEGGGWSAGLVTADRRLMYRIEDGIPVLLVDEAVSTARITDFPA